MAGKVGLVVGGGPAPGINGVIAAATIEAVNRGKEVIGIRDGFKYLVDGDASRVMKLDIETVSRIHLQGGSILRTSRVNPTKNEETTKKVLECLKKLDIGYLIMIGGEGTLAVANIFDRTADGALKIVHVPKTIDNDLPLPGNMPSFGFETAQHVGAVLVSNIMEDAKTTSRWFFVVAMGRGAGHLALGIAKAAGTTLAVIPEEFEDGVPVQRVCDTIEGSIIKRLSHGRDYGVVMIAEGMAEKLSKSDLETLGNIQRDEHGHLKLADIGFAEFLKRQVEQSLKSRGITIPITDKNIGYELRCAPPVPYDMEYTRDLGYAAIKFLLEGGSGATVASWGGKAVSIPFSDIIDSGTGRPRPHGVDIHSNSYEVALRYMIRLRKDDFKSPQEIKKLAEAAKMDEGAFTARFQAAAV